MQREKLTTAGTRTAIRYLCAAWIFIGCYDELHVADVTHPELETPSDTDEDENPADDSDQDENPADDSDQDETWNDEFDNMPPSIDCGDQPWLYSVFIDDILKEEWNFAIFTHIHGDLNLSDPGEEYIGFSDLSELRNIRCIDGNVFISDLPYLENLDALSELEKIGGRLYINNNDSLEDISGLFGVDYFGGRILSIIGNKELPTCQAIRFKTTFEDDYLSDYRSVCITLNKSDECQSDNKDCSDI